MEAQLWSKKNTLSRPTNRKFGLDWSSNHLPIAWPDKKWQKPLRCSRFTATSLEMSRRLIGLSFGLSYVNATILLRSNQPRHLSSHVATSSIGLLYAYSTLSAGLRTGPDVVGEGSPHTTHDLAIVVCINLFPWEACNFNSPNTHFHTPRLLTLTLYPVVMGTKSQWMSPKQNKM